LTNTKSPHYFSAT